MASGASGSGNGRSVDDFTMILALLAGSVIAIFIAWLAFHTELSMAYTYVRRVELWWLDMIGATGLPGAAAVSKWFAKGCAASGLLERCTRDFSTMSWREITNLAFYVNVILLPFIMLFAFKIFANIQSKHPNNRFSKTFNVDSFVREKKPLYRHLRMFDALDLIEAPLDHPVLGMSQTSRQFVYHHRLIVDNGEPGDGWIEEADGSVTPVLDRAKAERVLREQLGSVWTGVANLTPAETLLLAIAIPRVAATDGSLDDAAFKACLAESNEMVNWCWDQFKPPPKDSDKADKAGIATDPLAWLQPQIDLTVPRTVIARHIESKPMQAILGKHAYVRTILFAMFTAARSLGVLPPADMRWMRFFDRTLWYVLQNFGRQGAYVEGSAVHVHYLYEIKSNNPLIEPQLDKAITALDMALTAFRYRPSDRDAYRAGARSIAEALPPELTEQKDQAETPDDRQNAKVVKN